MKISELWNGEINENIVAVVEIHYSHPLCWNIVAEGLYLLRFIKHSIWICLYFVSRIWDLLHYLTVMDKFCRRFQEIQRSINIKTPQCEKICLRCIYNNPLVQLIFLVIHLSDILIWIVLYYNPAWSISDDDDNEN